MTSTASITLPEGDFRGFIFDNDGTLACSMHLHHRAWQAAFEKQGAPFTFTWPMFMEYAGMGATETVNRLNSRFKATLDPVLVATEQQLFVDRNFNQITPNAPVVALARQVAARYPVAVASGGIREVVLRTLQVIGVSDLFPVVVSVDDVARGKPAPDCFLLAAEKMGVAPAHCLVIEDGDLGEAAALAAGMTCLRVEPR